MCVEIVVLLIYVYIILISPVRAYVLQIAILSNHQNGRDTHVRQVKLFGPEYVFSYHSDDDYHCFPYT